MMKPRKPLPGVPIFLHVASMPEPKEWIPQLIGWEPMNLQDIGSVCLVRCEDNSLFYIGKSSNWILTALCRYYNLDLKEMRYKFQLYSNRYQWVPICVPLRNLVFLAVKTRVPETHNEPAGGYIANTAICRIELLEEQITRIHLVTGQHVDALMSKKLLRDRKHIAEMFAYLLRRDGIM